MIIPSARRWLAWAVAIAAGLGGAAVALHYHHLGLTLSHYDSRGHLVVARRIFDSITPGWQQIGAVWLPLPHLLNAIPVQIDLFYRSGASAVAISIVAFAIATASIASIVLALTGSSSAALAGAAVFALNPNMLYLQSTPMSEPLLLALTTAAVAMLIAHIADREMAGSPDRGSTRSPRAKAPLVGWLFALACLTRYEAWPVAISALIAAGFARWRQGASIRAAAADVGRIALYPAIAVAGFSVFSRVVVGEWFVSGGFFVHENKAIGDPVMAAKEIGWGVRLSSGLLLTALGGAGAALLAVMALVSRRRATALIPVSLLGMAAIPWTAFLDGHPFRLRYVLPLLAMEGVGAGALAGFIPRAGVLGALLLAAVAVFELRPLDASAPMVVEAQWDSPNQPVRARVTACLDSREPGDKIMASMGSLGHYMQEASGAGFDIRDFLHEGNGDIWLAALEGPWRYAGWILIEEKAEGGDMLARIARERPAFLHGYRRMCEGAGLALYKRDEGKALKDDDKQ